jgi:hypothetical protein
MKPEERGAIDACCLCKDPNRPICNVLKLMKGFAIDYKGLCGRDTETGVLFTRGDVNEGQTDYGTKVQDKN